MGMAAAGNLAGREVRPSFARLRFLFDTDEDLRGRLGLSNSRENPILSQAILRQFLYDYDRLCSPEDETLVSESAARYREVAVRRFVQDDPDSSAVGLDLLAALPLRDDEKAYVLGLKPQYIEPPRDPWLDRCDGPYARAYPLARRFREAAEPDLPQVAQLAQEVIHSELGALEEAMRNRIESGIERIFVLPGSDVQDKHPPSVRACVRLWFLNTEAVLGIRGGRIRSGADIGDQEFEALDFEGSNHVDDPSLVAGVYIPLLVGRGMLAGAAAGYWLRSYLMGQFPGRPVFARPTTRGAFRAIGRTGAQKAGGANSEIYELAEIPG